MQDTALTGRFSNSVADDVDRKLVVMLDIKSQRCLQSEQSVFILLNDKSCMKEYFHVRLNELRNTIEK